MKLKEKIGISAENCKFLNVNEITLRKKCPYVPMDTDTFYAVLMFMLITLTELVIIIYLGNRNGIKNTGNEKYIAILNIKG